MNKISLGEKSKMRVILDVKNGGLDKLLTDIQPQKVADLIQRSSGKQLDPHYFSEWFHPKYVMLDQNDSGGYKGVAIIDEIPGANAMYLDKFFIDPDCQRNGVGREMFASAVALADGRLLLRAYPGNDKANKFYGGTTYRSEAGTWTPHVEGTPGLNDGERNGKPLLIPKINGDWIMYLTPGMFGGNKNQLTLAVGYAMEKPKALRYVAGG